MASGDNAGGSGVAGIAAEDLETSRAYYEKTLADVGNDPVNGMEKARALHSLAHIERKLGIPEKSALHFREAIGAFGRELERTEKDGAGLVDLHARLADSYESLSALLKNPFGLEALDTLGAAVTHFEGVASLKPRDAGNLTRLAGTAFKLGGAYDAHRRHDEAIAAYARSAALAESLREEEGADGDDSVHLTELIGQLQFHTARSLRLAGRSDEAIDAHVSAMETLETLRGVNGFTPVQALQLAESYLELGELFAEKEASPEDLDQLFNESLRLVTPLYAENPADVPVAALLCRSLVHLGKLEREEAKWSSGYRLTVRGIEALGKALEEHPEHVAGHIGLAEAKLSHLEFLEGDREDSVSLALKGIEVAEKAALLLGPGSREFEPVRTRLRERLSTVFQAYGEICVELGETEVAERCRERAVLEVTSLEPVVEAGESE
jgi:tetratricopeptide (TPR) repeat protein